jgi:hypothetical protein
MKLHPLFAAIFLGLAAMTASCGASPADAQTSLRPSGLLPVTANLAVLNATSGTFTPTPGRPINAQITGTFVGTFRIERSLDAGVTWAPMTSNGTGIASFTGPASEILAAEPEWGAIYRWKCTAYTSGTGAVRLSH